MMEAKMSEQLVLQWVPVVDASGETRLEGVWSTTSVAQQAGHAA